jgi:predicted component of type VI protein secretion system
MAKLVILTQGMVGRAHELNVDRTTVGRVEDNTFQIADPSVSSHHCEILLRSGEILIRDLNSTNGTFINEARITESVLKPGQTLRLGQIEMKLEDGSAGSAPAPAAPATPAGAPSPAPAKKTVEGTLIMPRGVSLSDLESRGHGATFDTTGTFSKKRKSGGLIWIIFTIGFLVVIVLIIFVLRMAGSSH